MFYKRPSFQGVFYFFDYLDIDSFFYLIFLISNYLTFILFGIIINKHDFLRCFYLESINIALYLFYHLQIT